MSILTTQQSQALPKSSYFNNGKVSKKKPVDWDRLDKKKQALVQKKIEKKTSIFFRHSRLSTKFINICFFGIADKSNFQ